MSSLYERVLEDHTLIAAGWRAGRDGPAGLLHGVRKLSKTLTVDVLEVLGLKWQSSRTIFM